METPPALVALATCAPDGLAVEPGGEAGAPDWQVRRRRHSGLSAVLMCAAALVGATVDPMLGVVLIIGAVGFLRALGLSAASLRIGAKGVFTTTELARPDEIERCEVYDQFPVALVVIWDRDGDCRRIFRGSRAHADWIAGMIRALAGEPAPAVPALALASLPVARVVTARGHARHER